MNFFIKRGDTRGLFVPTSENPTGFTSLIFTMKESLGDADADAVVQKMNGYGLTPAADGVTVLLNHADTYPLGAGKTYHYDVQGSDSTRVVTLAQGQIRASQDVTRELSPSIPVVEVDPVNPATLAAEVLLRSAADLSLASSTTAEGSTRSAADVSLASAVSVEAGTRSAADLSLASSIASEASTRSAADTSLSAAITAEASTARAAEALKLDKSGGTMTGLLTANGGLTTTTLTTSGAITCAGTGQFGYVKVGTDTTAGNCIINGPSGSARQSSFRTANSTRAVLSLTDAAETGGNAGSNIRLDFYDDTGAYLRTQLWATRSSGDWGFNGNGVVNGAFSVAGATTLNALTANNGISTSTIVVGTSSGQGIITVDGIATTDKILLQGKSGGVRRSNLYHRGTFSDDIYWDDYDDSGAWLRTWLRHTRLSDTTTISGSLTAGTVTNYATAVTTSALLALTPAQSAAKRIASVSDCYGLDGLMGFNPAFWRGDASAGVWVIAGTSVPVTRDRLTFLRGLAKAGLQTICANINAGPLSRNGRQDFALASSGAAFSWQSEPTTLTFRVQTAGSYIHRATGSDNLVVATGAYHYSRCKMKVSRQGTTTDNAFTWFGLVQHPTNYPASATAHQAIVCHDAQNGSGILGANNGNLFLVVGNGTNGTAPVGLGAVPVGSSVIVEMFTSGASSVDVYINEVLAGSVATNLPIVGGIGMMWDMGVRATAYASTPTDSTFADLFQAVMF